VPPEQRLCPNRTAARRPLEETLPQLSIRGYRRPTWCLRTAALCRADREIWRPSLARTMPLLLQPLVRACCLSRWCVPSACRGPAAGGLRGPQRGLAQKPARAHCFQERTSPTRPGMGRAQARPAIRGPLCTCVWPCAWKTTASRKSWKPGAGERHLT